MDRLPQPKPAEGEHLWFVVFPARGLSRAAWWQRLLRPGYRHVWCCRAEGEATLVLNHAGRVLQLGVEAVAIGTFLRECQAAQAAAVLALPAPVRPPGAALRMPMTCVEAVKATLGVRAPWILTPWQLARHLRRLGALPVLPSTRQEIAHG
jgi:hypothetical protein